MATDTEKEAVVAGANTAKPPVAKVGDGGKISHERRLSIPARRVPDKKRLLLYILLAIILVAGGWIVLKQGFHVGQKVYAKVGNHKIYKQDIDGLVGKNKGVSDHDAAEVLANMYLYESMAKDMGLKITDKDIEAAYGPGIDQQKKMDRYAYQSRVNDLYYQKLQAYNEGIYKGYLLVTHFSRNISLQPQGKSSFPTNTGNSAAIAADQKYAKDFITKLYDGIESHKLTWNQAAKMEKTDRQVGTIMYPSQTHSGPFDTSKLTNSLLIPPSAASQLRKLKAGQTSKPFAPRIVTTVGDTNKSFYSYYLVVRMDYRYGGVSDLSILQEITNAQKKVGYKIYV